MSDLQNVIDQLRRHPGNARWIVMAIVALLVVILVFHSIVVVGAGERAVIFSRLGGVQETALGEGLHLIIPGLWKATKYDVRTLTYTMGQQRQRQADAEDRTTDQPLNCLTLEGLPVELDTSIRFHLDPVAAWKLHREIGPLYVDKVIRPQARSIVRMIVARYGVIDLYTGKRNLIIKDIASQLTTSFEGSYIILDEVLLRNVRFPPSFQHAIEQKQVALQQTKRMDFVLQKARLERQRKIVEAEGEAKAVQLKGDAIAKNPLLIRYEYVRKLPDGLDVIVTEADTIINLGELLERRKAARIGGASR